MAVWERAGKARGALSVPRQGPSAGSFPAITCPSASFSLPQSLASPSAHPSGRSLVPAPLLISIPLLLWRLLFSFLNENSFLGVSIFVLIKVIWVCYKSFRLINKI